MVKPRLYNESSDGYESAVATLKYVLENILKLLHPYMPFITEEIYSNLETEDEALIIAKYPEAKYNFEQDEKFEEELISVIREIRNARANAGLTNSKKINMTIYSKNYLDNINKSVEMLKKLLSVEELTVADTQGLEGTAIHTQNIDVVLDMSIGINKEEQNAKVQAEIIKAESELKRAQGMLANEKFVSKAPAALIEAEKEKVKKYTELIEKLQDSLK